MNDAAVVVVDSDLLDPGDLVDSEALERRLEALVVSRGGLVDGLLLAARESGGGGGVVVEVVRGFERGKKRGVL